MWLLVEHSGRWEYDIAGTELPEVTRAWLDEFGARHPRSRVQLIRRDRRGPELSFYVVTTAPRRAVHRFRAASHEALADIDLEAVMAGGTQAVEAMGGERSGPLYLVCAHGRRDVCCARKGMAMYRALEPLELDGELWLSSHQGGHRFAATMLYLPHGVHYGRVEPEEAAALVAAHARGELHDLRRYRGLTTLSAASQRAEAWLREQLGDFRLDALQWLSDEGAGEAGRRAVAFRSRDGQIHRLVVARRKSAELRMASCARQDRPSDAPSPVEFYDVVRHEAHT